MTSQKPYLLRAIYEWVVDNQGTPYVLVDAAVPGTQVPNEHVQEGRIVLNLGPDAVNSLHMGNDEVSFSARFGGVARQLILPMEGILALYSRETGEGMMFNPPADEVFEEGDEGDDRPVSKAGISLVSDGAASEVDAEPAEANVHTLGGASEESVTPELPEDLGAAPEGQAEDEPPPLPPKPPAGGGRPRLKVVK